jgi:hypothetical protein
MYVKRTNSARGVDGDCRGIASGKFALANAEIGAATWNLLPPKSIRVGEFGGSDQGRIGLRGSKSTVGEPFLTSG